MAVGNGRPAAGNENIPAVISALVAERIKQGISQADISDKIGVNGRDYLSKLENGRHGCRLEYIERYADALGFALTITRATPTTAEDRIKYLAEHFTSEELAEAQELKK